MNAEQLLEFEEQHIDELPHLMGDDERQAFRAVQQSSVQQMREGISPDAPPPDDTQRRSQPPADTTSSEQRFNQVVNRFRELTQKHETASTDEKSESSPKRPEPADRRPR